MKRKILLVEDSMTIAVALDRMLSEQYQVEHINDANNIIEDVRLIRPDLILMDVVMPGVSGFGATRTLKQHQETRDIPLIVCSSKSMETDSLWARRNGADDFIVKPPSKSDLLSKIEDLLRKKGAPENSVDIVVE